MKTALLLLAGVLCALSSSPSGARPLVRIDDKEEAADDADWVQGELDELQKRIEKGEIPPIEFETGSAELKPSSLEALRLIADLLKRRRSMRLRVVGHTDNVGGKEYNYWLSQKRAESVKGALIELGILGEHIRAKGYGLEKPVASNDTPEGRAKNRRVDIVVLQTPRILPDEGDALDAKAVGEPGAQEAAVSG
ncbi:MAG: OmpA family protein, partial [Elusimicrobiota bacterium]